MAIALAKQFRTQDMKVELYLEENENPDYAAYARRMKLGGVLYLKEEGFVEIFNALDATKNRVALKDFL